MAEDVSGLA